MDFPGVAVTASSHVRGGARFLVIAVQAVFRTGPEAYIILSVLLR